jgi:ComF family protein
MKILKKIKPTLNIGINMLKDLFFPLRCDLCGNFTDTNGLCPPCWSKITWISDPKCQICGTPFDTNINLICANCLQKRPHFDRAVSVFEYNEFSKGIIIKFKHCDAIRMANPAASWIYRAAETEINAADMIIPVPIHLFKRLKRKYNQSELLAREISKISGILYEPRILRKIKHTRQQEGLSANARKRNLVGSFGVDEAYVGLLQDKNIILADDVFTTGSTLNECAKILKKHGAKTVICVTMAKTLHR